MQDSISKRVEDEMDIENITERRQIDIKCQIVLEEHNKLKEIIGRDVTINEIIRARRYKEKLPV